MPDLLGAVWLAQTPAAGPPMAVGTCETCQALDATALHDDTLANSVPPSEACNHAES